MLDIIAHHVSSLYVIRNVLYKHVVRKQVHATDLNGF